MTASARAHLEIEGSSHIALGAARGRLLDQSLPLAFAGYSELFETLGITSGDVQRAGESSLEAVSAFNPGYAEQIQSLAATVGMAEWQVSALNARTEILSGAGVLGARECSTVAAPLRQGWGSAQTWDWHDELSEYWHTQTVRGPGLEHVGVTEQGILAKIGLNEAGLGVHLNILAHRQDAVGGVPVHILCAAVLSECRSVEEAQQLLGSAEISSSSVLTLVESGRTVMCELSPAGVFIVEQSEGPLLHTNHFLRPEPAEGERSEAYNPDSIERMELLKTRAEAPTNLHELSDVVGMLRSGPGDAQLCCLPEPGLSLGHRWRTLATVALDPSRRTAEILDGMPTEAEEKEWLSLTV
ncbi:C45 family autoproteolytic acyltransferase/hydolase [Nesterenkonia natronophila]|uniref:Peptidase C45 hydrolase domain-containing protein n=1 Tax=Nesterenkonia natronophila TaxID=2174932 RepID=A0A3A4F3Q6_9MICC|nr:C45 family peptidase [Nesterenkonia natronophila]RJN32381.1 hypothetical protein D3250_00525 [Nesterenkonia natronophila]